jgi:Raf kinase inhibitor-like YbhB/YbcL family protein
MEAHVKLKMGTLSLASPAFAALARIPDRHTGVGENVSPALRWSGTPSGTKEFALICHDPDAPLPRGFTHWVIYGMPPAATGIPEGGGGSFTEGVNGTGKKGYTGPMPPQGHGPHHYYFWVYALDKALGLKAGLDRDTLLDAIEDHVIEQARLVGVFQR